MIVLENDDLPHVYGLSVVGVLEPSSWIIDVAELRAVFCDRNVVIVVQGVDRSASTIRPSGTKFTAWRPECPYAAAHLIVEGGRALLPLGVSKLGEERIIIPPRLVTKLAGKIQDGDASLVE